MNLIRIFAVAILLPLALVACQTAQVGTSSFAGNQLSNAPVKKRVAVTPRKFENEAASSALTVEERRALKRPKKVTPRVFENQAASLVIQSLRGSTTAIAKPKRKPTKTKRVASKKKKIKRVARKSSKGRQNYRRLIAKHARANGVPLKLALAVVQVESSYRANARGAAGEIGLMQLMPATARHIGYKGPLKKLYNPDLNLRYGMKYLGKAHRLGKGSTCGTILKYNAGHGAKRMNPISRKYCQRVRRIMRRG